MKKKYIVFFLIILLSILSTGCMRVHTNISLNKDGSGTLEYVVAVSGELMNMGELQGEEDPFEEMRKEAIIEGFEVLDYQEDGYSGLVISRDFSNISEVNMVNFMEGIAEEDEMINQQDFASIFEPYIQVEEGFLFTTYILNTPTGFDENSVADSDMTEEIEEMEEMEGMEGTEDLEMLGSMMGNMMGDMFDIQLNLNLPTAAQAHNASITENSGKTLRWNIMDGEEENIYVEFRVIDKTDLILLILLAATLLVLVLFVISRVTGSKTVNY